ncbi:MAG: hypothetical protein ABF391_10825 [Akkermansiaceae bacterium]
MISKPVTVHGIWGAAMIGAFFVGTSWQKAEYETNSGKVTSVPSTRTPSTLPLGSGTDASGPQSQRSRSGRKDVVSEVFEANAFSEMGIDGLAAMAFKDPNQVKRRLAFSRLLAEMTSDNAMQIREKLMASGMNTRDPEWRDFNYAWGTIAGESAFSESLDMEQKDLYSVISGWATTDPTGAMAMLDRLPENLADQKKRLEEGVVAGLADRNRDEATAYVSKLLAGGRTDAARLMENVASEVIRQEGPVEASNWISTLEDGPLKGSAMNKVAERYARTDPEAAAGWIQAFAAEDYATRAVAQVGEKWAEREPLAAVSWLDQLPEGPGQKAGLNSAFGDWEDRDPIAAGQYLLDMPNSPKRDSAIKGFAEGYAWQDPQTAIAWAQDIQDPAIRSESLKKVGYAYYRRKPEEAKAWLTNSGLSAEVQTEILNSRRRR